MTATPAPRAAIDRGDFENRMIQHVKYHGSVKADQLCHYFRNICADGGVTPQQVMWEMISRGDLTLTANWCIVVTRPS